jgi:hypothetical protein
MAFLGFEARKKDSGEIFFAIKSLFKHTWKIFTQVNGFENYVKNYFRNQTFHTTTVCIWTFCCNIWHFTFVHLRYNSICNLPIYLQYVYL